MRVVLISRGYHDYVSHLANALSDLADTSIVVSARSEAMVERLAGRVRVVRTISGRVASPANMVGMLLLGRKLRSLGVDIVHAQSGVMWELALRFFLREIPWVVTCHDIVRHPTFRHVGSTPSFMLRAAVGASEGVIVHSSALATQAQEKWGSLLKSRRMAIIPHGVIGNYGVGVARSRAEGGRVLFFGTIDKYKGLDILARAWPTVTRDNPGAQLIVAGKLASRDFVSSLFVGCPNTTLSLRHQSDEEVRGLFRWADVLVLPYTEASQSGVLHLGMSFGVPTVVTAVGGLPDVVEDGVNGLVVPPGDPLALARSVGRLLWDTGLRNSIIDATVRLRDDRYSWRTIAALTVSYYEEVLSRERVVRAH